MLDAAEVLHAKYEMLVRTIRPVLKEMDEFHKVLYVVYHKDLPAKNWEAIRAAAPDLKAKAEAVTQAKLSTRLEPKAETFAKAVGGARQGRRRPGRARRPRPTAPPSSRRS